MRRNREIPPYDTTANGSVEIRSDRVDGVAFIGMICHSVRIAMLLNLFTIFYRYKSDRNMKCICLGNYIRHFSKFFLQISLVQYAAKKIVAVVLLVWSQLLVQGDQMLILLEKMHVVCQ